MKIINNLQSFLKDQDYYIDIFKDFLHVYDYLNLTTLTSTLIEIKLKEFNLIIEGDNLVIKSMDKKEILLKGLISSVRFVR